MRSFSAVNKVRQQPSLFPTYLHGTRRVVLNRYPFSIDYRELLDEIQIIAVAHAKRQPSYWANRL